MEPREGSERPCAYLRSEPFPPDFVRVVPPLWLAGCAMGWLLVVAALRFDTPKFRVLAALILNVPNTVLSYIVEQRAKDIGVRMALGATTRNVARLVLSQSMRPVGIGLVAGGGLAAALAIVLMATPAASEIGNLVHVFDPVAYAASLLVIVASCMLAASVPAFRAARLDPIATLRMD